LIFDNNKISQQENGKSPKQLIVELTRSQLLFTKLLIYLNNSAQSEKVLLDVMMVPVFSYLTAIDSPGQARGTYCYRPAI